MGLAIADAVKELGSVTGTGDIVLSGVTITGGRLLRDALPSGATAVFRAQNADKTLWEDFWGTFTNGSPDTLSRQKVIVSSNPDGEGGYDKVSFEGAVSVTLVDSAELVGIPGAAYSYSVTTGDLDGGRCSAYSVASPIELHYLPDGARVYVKIHAPNKAGASLPTLTVPVVGGDVTLPITKNGGASLAQDDLTTGRVLALLKLTAGFEIVGEFKPSVADGSIAGAKLADGAVTLAKLATALRQVAAPFSFGFARDGSGRNIAANDYDEFVLPWPCQAIAGSKAYLGSAATGAALKIDIFKNGTTIFSAQPQFADGSTTFTAGTLSGTVGDLQFAAGDRIGCKVPQVGSTAPGQKLEYTQLLQLI